MTSDREWNPDIYDQEVNIENLPRQLHMLPHADYNTEGEYIFTAQTEREDPEDVGEIIYYPERPLSNESALETLPLPNSVPTVDLATESTPTIQPNGNDIPTTPTNTAPLTRVRDVQIVPFPTSNLDPGKEHTIYEVPSPERGIYASDSSTPLTEYELPDHETDLALFRTKIHHRNSISHTLTNPTNTPQIEDHTQAHGTDTAEPSLPTIPTQTLRFWIPPLEFTRAETITRCINATHFSPIQDISNRLFDHEISVFRAIHNGGIPRTHVPSATDFEALKPYFSWLPTKIIRHTFDNSTQYGYMPSSPDGNLFKRWKAPNPAMNVFRLHDDLLTDKIVCDTKALDCTHSDAQVFIGRRSHIIHVEPISEDFPFIKGLQNFVRKWGAPNRLLADHAGNQASSQVMDYLRLLWIGYWCSEPYYQHQNLFERRYQTFKRVVNRTMDRTNSPPELWYLCMQYIAFVFNHVSDPSLNHRQPIFVATGQVGDISPILTF